MDDNAAGAIDDQVTPLVWSTPNVTDTVTSDYAAACDAQWLPFGGSGQWLDAGQEEDACVEAVEAARLDYQLPSR